MGMNATPDIGKPGIELAAKNEPSEEEIMRRESEQEQADKLKFTRMQKTKEMTVRGILLQSKTGDRSSLQEFFLRMHLSMNVQFFANYNG